MNNAPLAFGSELTIAGAADAHAALVAAAAPGGDLHLDLHGLDEFDSAGVQLLLATHRSVAARGSRLHIDSASATVRDALRVFGLEWLLNEPAVEPA